jgi:hypothetical protein
MKQFVVGKSNIAELTAELLGTGLTALQTAAWVELAQLQKGGGLRFLFGKQIPIQDAILLRQRVAALTDQRKRLQISDQQYHDQLAGLGLGENWVNALQATADAMITPKASAFEVPVSTTPFGQGS